MNSGPTLNYHELITRLYFLKQNTLYFKPTFIHVQDINSDVSESLAATNISCCKLVRKSKYLVTLYYLQIILKSWSQKITVAATKQCTSSNSQNKVTAKLKKKLVYSKQILGSPEHILWFPYFTCKYFLQQLHTFVL